MFKQIKTSFLFIGDIIILHISLFIALYLRYGLETISDKYQDHWPSFIIVFIIWLIVIYINNLYNINIKVDSKTFIYSIINTTIISTLLSVLYFYLDAKPNISPKTNLSLFALIFIILFIIWRYLFQIIITHIIPKTNLAIIGDNIYTTRLIKVINDNPSFGYKISTIFDNSISLEELNTHINDNKIKAIVITDTFNDDKKIQRILFDCLKYNIAFLNYQDLYENLTGKVPVETIGPDWFITNLKKRQKKYFDVNKQIIDYVLAIIILLITLPFWPLIAIGIKLSSPGPIFFTQSRLGLQGKTFKIIKFRTMRINNNNRSPITDDNSRITKFGLFIRKSRIDEIPQVLNIIHNEMSFIGPRPECPSIAINLEKEIPFYNTRSLIKPGLSGWDQISGHYHSSSLEDSLEKLQYDLYYLKHRSLYLDVSIALKTIITMINRVGK